MSLFSHWENKSKKLFFLDGLLNPFCHINTEKVNLTQQLHYLPLMHVFVSRAAHVPAIQDRHKLTAALTQNDLSHQREGCEIRQGLSRRGTHDLKLFLRCREPFAPHVKARREVRWKELVERPSKSENKRLIGHLFPSTWVCGGCLWSAEKWRKRSRNVGHCYTQRLCTHTHMHTNMHNLSKVSIQMVFNLPPTHTHTWSSIFLLSQSIQFRNRPLTQISFNRKHTLMSCTDSTHKETYRRSCRVLPPEDKAYCYTPVGWTQRGSTHCFS